MAGAIPFPSTRPIAFTRLVPRGLVDKNGVDIPLPGEPQEIVAFSGIAQNDQFEHSLRTSGFLVRRFFGFPDHHRYRPADIERIRSASDGLPVVTTEKDLVRMPREAPFLVAALRVEVEFLSGWEDLSLFLLERIGRREKR
jgi:tetraacyldisaccharide 4'-kinase